mgnify:CR=1 FL=1
MTNSEVILYPCSEVDWLGLWAAKDFLKLKGVFEENTIFNVVTANTIHQANLPKLHIVSIRGANPPQGRGRKSPPNIA